MDGDEVSYETLQDLLRQEKRSNRLAPITDGFWKRLRAFLQEIESEFHREQGKDPFSRRVSLLRDRVIHAQQAADSVWTLRERKIAMLAVAHAKEPGKAEGLTNKEQILYDGLVGVLRTGRQTIFAGTSVAPIDDGDPTTMTKPRPAAPQPAEPAPEPAVAGDDLPVDDDVEPLVDVPEVDSDQDMESVPEPPEVPTEPVRVPADTPDDGNVAIRALGDIPPFVGPDMQTYLLKEGDLATVPQNIADLLIKRGKAAVVEAA